MSERAVTAGVSLARVMAHCGGPQLPNPAYRHRLIDCACEGPGLPAELIAAARRLQEA